MFYHRLYHGRSWPRSNLNKYYTNNIKYNSTHCWFSCKTFNSGVFFCYFIEPNKWTETRYVGQSVVGMPLVRLFPPLIWDALVGDNSKASAIFFESFDHFFYITWKNIEILLTVQNVLNFTFYDVERTFFCCYMPDAILFYRRFLWSSTVIWKIGDKASSTKARYDRYM